MKDLHNLNDVFDEINNDLKVAKKVLKRMNKAQLVATTQALTENNKNEYSITKALNKFMSKKEVLSFEWSLYFNEPALAKAVENEWHTRIN